MYTIIVYKTSLNMPKGLIRSRKSKKERQRNSRKKTDKRINNDLQNICE